MKAVCDTTPGSVYDDDIVTQYHFPSRYLDTVRAAVGDWIVYREPRVDGGSMSYFAAAHVAGIDPDPAKPGHYYARMDDYVQFDQLVPRRDAAGRYAEAALRELPNPSGIGVYLRGRSVRSLGGADFADIVGAGLAATLDPANALRLGLPPADLAEDAAGWIGDAAKERRVAQLLVNRKIRDANFRLAICTAYDNRCAVTGLQIVNGGGRAEVQAAHILPVERGGPDIVQNGIALSATVHWLFDRHLISLTDDYALLVAHNRVPGELRSLFERQMNRIHLPADRRLWPSPKYLNLHREAFAVA